MGSKTSLEPERIRPDRTVHHLSRAEICSDGLPVTVSETRNIDLTSSTLTLDRTYNAQAPAHHRGLGPQRQCFTFNSRQDTNKEPSAPLSKLVTHPATLSGGPYQASRNKITEIGTRFFRTHAEALPILAVVPRTPPLLRASSSLSSTMTQQEHPLLQ